MVVAAIRRGEGELVMLVNTIRTNKMRLIAGACAAAAVLGIDGCEAVCSGLL